MPPPLSLPIDLQYIINTYPIIDYSVEYRNELLSDDVDLIAYV